MDSSAETRQPPPPSPLEAVGGPLGIGESALPPIAFVVIWAATGNEIGPAAVAAVAIGMVFAALRIARRQSARFALAGVVGVGIAAFVASRTGRAQDFFLPGILANVAYAAVWAGSIAIDRPLLGYIVAPLTGEGSAWRHDEARMRAYRRGSWIWVGVFSARLAIRLPLYFTGTVILLGGAQVATGVPLFALGVWLSWLLLRGTPPARPLRAPP